MTTTRTIHIDPVTRIEGHGRVVINLDEAGGVRDAFFQTKEFRGFEKFCEGRMVWDMPLVTSRICGFCPVSHHVASVKAIEDLLGAKPPPAATLLRELLHMGQTIQSHALHFFLCAMPDFLGKGTTPEKRSIFGIIETNERLAQNAIRLRKVGQDIIDAVGGGRLHPVACIPGGMSRGLGQHQRAGLLKAVAGGVRLAQMAIEIVKDMHNRNGDAFARFAAFPSAYMGLVKEGNLELYDGAVRIAGADGTTLQQYEGKEYLQVLEERVDPRSWTKSVHLREQVGAREGGFFRVASLARLNVADGISTPLAGAEFAEFRKLGNGRPLEGGLFYHYARMIELLYAVENAKALLSTPDIMSDEVRVPVARCGGEGVGVVEAPRGTLFHHYWANDSGRITKVNLIVSTAHNKIAMDKSVEAVARSVVKGSELTEADMNQIEMAIRCYDPCLSCSTHAYGKMPLVVSVLHPDGSTAHEYCFGEMAGTGRHRGVAGA